MTTGARVSSGVPLALYVHLPWCVRKCPYCDFNSHALDPAQIPDVAYVDALLRDLAFSAADTGGREIGSVFLGGGTPSLFSAESITRLIDGIAARTPLAADAEITLEANPGTVEARRFGAYREAGVNRLSIGVQSFSDDALRGLGRIHGAAEARAAIHIAHGAGFRNVNLDIMYGLPAQTPEQAMFDLEEAVAAAPTHLSWYQLTLEPNTVFHAAPPQLPDADVTWEMQCMGEALLEEAGFAQYEVSAYAREEGRCRHNLNYWTFGDYLGIGAGAHAKISDMNVGAIRRERRHALPLRYMELAGTQAGVAETRVPDLQEIIFEFLLNACRLRQGFTTALFSARTGLAADLLEDRLAPACAHGYIEYGGGDVRVTAHGRRFLNDLLEMFLPDAK